MRVSLKHRGVELNGLFEFHMGMKDIRQTSFIKDYHAMATPYYRVDCENTSHMRKIPCLERKNIFGSYGAKLLIMGISEEDNDNGSVVGVYYVKGGEIRYNPVL